MCSEYGGESCTKYKTPFSQSPESLNWGYSSESVAVCLYNAQSTDDSSNDGNMSTNGFSNSKWIKLNEKDIPLQNNPDERISYFKDFTLPVSLNNYNKVRIIAVNYQKFPNAPVYQLKRKKNSWIFIDELIFW